MEDSGKSLKPVESSESVKSSELKFDVNSRCSKCDHLPEYVKLKAIYTWVTWRDSVWQRPAYWLKVFSMLCTLEDIDPLQSSFK